MKTNGARFGMIAVGLAALAWVGVVGIAGAQEFIEISSIGDLRKIGNEAGYPLDGHYVLTQDIEKSETATWNDGKGFEPIGAEDNRFTGTFDGQEYVIPGLGSTGPMRIISGCFGIWAMAASSRTWGSKAVPCLGIVSTSGAR